MEYKSLQELFADESRWTKHVTAKDKNDKVVNADDENAVCWCLIGGVVKVYKSYEKSKPVFTKIKTYLGIGPNSSLSIDTWNDMYIRIIKDIQKLCKECNI